VGQGLLLKGGVLAWDGVSVQMHGHSALQVNHRMWSSQNPLRQFKVLAKEVLSRLEKKDLAWERYYDLSPEELGELVSVCGGGG
jgi:hypothetical protein